MVIILITEIINANKKIIVVQIKIRKHNVDLQVNYCYITSSLNKTKSKKHVNVHIFTM